MGGDPPEYVKPIWKDYMAFHNERDAATRHQKLHESHYSYLDPDEARFITPEIIRNFCIVGQPAEIVEQLGELERQGLNAINFIAPLHQQYRLIEDFAENVMSRM
jgi:alkanesulfonate monooxygenase SsuD/methylene tetrahydromethanopterin reductase-like flavin-dependent oxidoreductase (luciferase family)